MDIFGVLESNVTIMGEAMALVSRRWCYNHAYLSNSSGGGIRLILDDDTT